MKVNAPLLTSLIALWTMTPSSAAQDNTVPPPLSLDMTNVTVSGLSSGGYMATQFHLAHSDWVTGVGVLAAGPYYCAQGDITQALAKCVDKLASPIDIVALNKHAKTYEEQGKIAPLENLHAAKVWLYHGTKDTRVIRKVSDRLYEQYQAWVDENNIKYVNDKPTAHLFPTQKNGGDCQTSKAPYIGKCNYDAAGAMLSHLVGDLNSPDDQLSGALYTIDQHASSGGHASTLAKEAFVYVPENCASGEPCRAHISFHGCNQYADAVGNAYVTQTGINTWADDNNIVVLYPQTKKSLFMPLNPQGCWDWWGYTSSDYANRDGEQIKAVTQMLKSLNHEGGSARHFEAEGAKMKETPNE